MMFPAIMIKRASALAGRIFVDPKVAHNSCLDPTTVTHMNHFMHGLLLSRNRKLSLHS